MRVYVETLGRPHPAGKGHDLERRLHDLGHSIAPSPQGADVGVFVACSAVRPVGPRAAHRWRLLVDQVPRVVVTGCAPPSDDAFLEGPGGERTSWLPIADPDRIAAVLEAIERGPDAVGGAPSEANPRATVASVLVSSVCVDPCTYCAPRHGSDPTISVPLPEVVRRVERARDLGATEIGLVAPDTSAWGEEVPNGPRLPELLQAASSVSGGFRLKLGPMNPHSLAPIAEEYLNALTTTKAFRFLHLPLRSGSDVVLGSMHATYTVAEFRRIVRTARRQVPDVLLATDVVVGHPSETEDDFLATLEVLEEVRPDVVHSRCFSQESPEGTVPPHAPSLRVARRRSHDVTELATRLARDRLGRWVGWEGTVVIAEHGPDGSCVGRLPNYLPMLLPERLSLGALAPVRVEGSDESFLHGHRTGPAETAPPVSA